MKIIDADMVLVRFSTICNNTDCDYVFPSEYAGVLEVSLPEILYSGVPICMECEAEAELLNVRVRQ